MPARSAEVEIAGSMPRWGAARPVRPGFTLIDILVSMAVIVVLISIMLPSLSSVKETAHQVVCRSNVRQMGFAFDLYAEANKGYIPSTATITNLQDLSDQRTFDTMTLRFGPGTIYTMSAPRWDGLGRFYEGEYLHVPKVFYCPSHRGGNRYVDYAESWNTVDEEVVANFQYRGRGPTGPFNPGSLNPPRMSNVLAQIRPTAALVADGLRTQADFNHEIGANVLRADLSVYWFSDSSRSVMASLPKDENETPVASNLQGVWNTFEQNNEIR